MNVFRLALAIVAVIAGTFIARAQFNPSTGVGIGAPGGPNKVLQFDTNGLFGGIAGVTSDQANVGFATSSQLILYGLAVGDCLKVGANNQIADFGAGCGGSGSPGGSNTQVQFNTAGSFGGVSGATSNGSNISFTTNSLVINGQAISRVSGTTGTIATITGTLGSGHCVQIDAAGNLIDSGTAACGGLTTQVSIAAGTNITTSGTATNVTINAIVPATTSIAAGTNISTTGTANNITVSVSPAGTTTQLQYNNASALGGVSGATSNGTNVSFTTNNLVINGQAISKVSGTTGTLASITGTLGSGHCIQLDASGNLIDSGSVACGGVTTQLSIAQGANITTTGTANNITVGVSPAGSNTQLQYNNNGALGAISGATSTGSTVVFTTNSLVINGQAISKVSGTTGTIGSVTGALVSGNCLQSDANQNIKDSGSTACGGLTTHLSIAAGSNITTSGTASNVTVNVVATPTFSSVTAGIAGFTGTVSVGGFLTAAGTSMQTATTVGNLTGTTIAIPGWLTATGANLQTGTIAGLLIGSTANFSGNLTGTTAQFSGLVTGTTGTFQTYTGATLNLSSNLTGTTAQFSGQVTGTTAVFQTVTAQNFTTVAQGFVGIPAAGSGTAFLRGDNTFSTPTTLGLTTSQGWVNWSGETRIAADSVGFITTGFANIMQVNVNAGKTYKFEAHLPLKSAAASTGGIGLRIGGGATATAIVYDGWIVDSGFNGIKGNTQATALSTTVASSSITGTTSHAELIGTITVNAAGTLILQASGFSTVTAASAVTIGRGATFIATDVQ